MEKSKAFDRIGNPVKSEHSAPKTHGFRAVRSLHNNDEKVLISAHIPLTFLAT